MHSFLAVVALAFSSVALALPTSQLATRDVSSQLAAAGVCDLSKVSVPLGSGLPPPSEGLYLAHVAIGRGTQNYTCSDTSATSTAVPTSIGANATLFNVTCLAASPQNLVSDLPAYALSADIPSSSNVNSMINQLKSGHHYFANMTTPFFDLHTDVEHDYGFVGAMKIATVAAPAGSPAGDNGLGSVAWLKLAGFEGTYKEVYRVDTAGGNPPKTCAGQAASFQVQYSAAYYFFASP